MRPVVTVAEMRKADAAAPVGVDVLVRRAGRAVFDEARDMLGGCYGRRVVVVAGKGNNGADGRAAAELLSRRGASVTVIDAPVASLPDSSLPGASVPDASLPDASVPGASLPDADLVIDAAYGTGFRGSYRAPDPRGALVLAVDVPSGLNGDTGEAGPDAVRADVTVTMAALKPGLLLGDGPSLAGRVVVADIGLPVGEASIHLVDDDDRAWIPVQPRSTNKWARALWIVAGSPGMRGAAVLCTRAAQRAGAGMVRIGSPGVAASEQPAAEAVAVDLPSERWERIVLGQLDRFHALVVGPGLGRSEAVQDSVRALVAGAGLPMVVDADGLNALRGPAPGAVLTPHEGEFARLHGSAPGADRIAAVRELADAMDAVVLLKGPTTVVAAPGGETLLSATGDRRLATAGTGDVLAGIIGAFLAAGVAPLRAAALGAHVHGRAAQHGHAVGLVASDIPDLLPRVLT